MSLRRWTVLERKVLNDSALFLAGLTICALDSDDQSDATDLEQLDDMLDGVRMDTFDSSEGISMVSSGTTSSGVAPTMGSFGISLSSLSSDSQRSLIVRIAGVGKAVYDPDDSSAEKRARKELRTADKKATRKAETMEAKRQAKLQEKREAKRLKRSASGMSEAAGTTSVVQSEATVDTEASEKRKKIKKRKKDRKSKPDSTCDQQGETSVSKLQPEQLSDGTTITQAEGGEEKEVNTP